MDPAVIFGHVLRSARVDARLTQEKLALEAGIERNFVSLIERGVNQPTIRVIFRLSAVLGIKPSELLARVEQQMG